jgi:hypothetical protein
VYDPKKERFTVRSSADVKASAIQLIRKLCELGWLYIHTHSCLRAMGRDSGAPSQPGLVGQALIEAVNSELREYFRYLASLEARVVGTTSKTIESTVLSHDSAGKGSITSLRQLSAWLVEPFRRLRALATLVDCVIDHKVRKGAIVCELWLLSAAATHANDGSFFFLELREARF